MGRLHRKSVYKGIAPNSYIVEWKGGCVETLSRSEAMFLKNKLDIGHKAAKCQMIDCLTGEPIREITA